MLELSSEPGSTHAGSAVLEAGKQAQVTMPSGLVIPSELHRRHGTGSRKRLWLLVPLAATHGKMSVRRSLTEHDRLRLPAGRNHPGASGL
jgi:hypothetical protein